MTPHATFHAGTGRTGPLTWGQSSIWEAMQQTAPDDHYFNNGVVVAIPARVRPVDPARLAGAMAAVCERHESLRTRLIRDDPTHQRVFAEGSLPLTVVVAEPGTEDETAWQVRDRLVAPHFDYWEEWPLRVGLVTMRGEVTHLVLAYCHLAADGLGCDLVIRDLMSVLGGRPPKTRAPQPLELAAWQRSPAGLRVADGAIAYWERELGRAPTATFDRESGSPPESPLVPQVSITSRAMALAIARIAAMHSVSSSSVLLTATTALVASETGNEVCAILPVVSNRFRPDTMGVVSTLSQQGLLVQEIGGRALPALLGPARGKILRAYRSAMHDPADRNRIARTIGASRGVAPAHPLCCFNDQRMEIHTNTAAEIPADAATIRDAMAHTTMAWQPGHDNVQCRFCVQVWDQPEGMTFWLAANTRFLSKSAMERFAWRMEETLVDAACAAL
jgi:hypothetical protein